MNGCTVKLNGILENVKNTYKKCTSCKYISQSGKSAKRMFFCNCEGAEGYVFSLYTIFLYYREMKSSGQAGEK